MPLSKAKMRERKRLDRVKPSSQSVKPKTEALPIIKTVEDLPFSLPKVKLIKPGVLKEWKDYKQAVRQDCK